jgi:flavin-dependent dehydrogenase
VNRQWDVIVVGGRVAGAATAMLLARGGLRVLCLDRSRYGNDTLSTHALMRGGVLQLNRWGLLDGAVAAGTPPVRRTVFHYGDETIAVSIKSSGGVDALYAPRRTVLDTLVVDAARRAGAVVRFGSVATRVLRNADGSVSGVTVHDRRQGTDRVESAPLVIGADGRDSVVARAVRARPVAHGRHAGSFLYSYLAGVPSDGYAWFYRPGVMGGAVPTNGGLTCVFVGTRPSDLDTAVRRYGVAPAFEVLTDQVGLGPLIADADRVEPVRHARGLPPGYLRPAHGAGWALVGDAGHWLDPVSTHGMTAALRDADFLAHAVLSSPQPGTDRARALATYEAARNRLSHPMMRLTDEIASFGWDMNRIRVLLRGLASAMTDEVETLAAIGVAA